MFVSHKIYLVRPFSPPGLLCLGAISPTLPSLSDVTDCYGLWTVLTHNAAMFVGNESAPKIIKEINHRFLFALQLTLVSNTSLAILTSVPLTHHSYHPSPAHSHFRLETFLFCKFFPPWPSFSSLWLTPRTPRSVYRQAYLWAYPFFLFSLSIFHFCISQFRADLHNVAHCWVMRIIGRERDFTSLHFTLFTQQFKLQMQCVGLQYATYSSLGRCSEAWSALTTAPSKEKEKKLVGIK